MKVSFTIRRQQIDGALAFLRVAEHGNFRAAAAELGISPSALSQTIKALEASLGAALFVRTTRSVGLTEAGTLFLEGLAPATEAMQKAFDAVQTLVGRPSGLLRLNASRGVIPFLLEPVLDGFCRQYPEVQVELHADDGLADIVGEGFDVGIRLGELLHADMIALRLSPPFSFCVAATPGYLAANGVPEHPEDLRHHHCIRYRHATSGRIYRWEFQDGSRKFEIEVAGPLIVNDTSVQVAAALRGAGLFYVAEPVIARHVEAGRLNIVLEKYQATSPGLFMYYPNRSNMLPKLRAFVDYMRGAVGHPGDGAA